MTTYFSVSITDPLQFPFDKQKALPALKTLPRGAIGDFVLSCLIASLIGQALIHLWLHHWSLPGLIGGNIATLINLVFGRGRRSRQQYYRDMEALFQSYQFPALTLSTSIIGLIGSDPSGSPMFFLGIPWKYVKEIRYKGRGRNARIRLRLTQMHEFIETFFADNETMLAYFSRKPVWKRVVAGTYWIEIPASYISGELKTVYDQIIAFRALSESPEAEPSYALER